MIRINLLPVRQIKQRIQARNDVGVLLGLLLLVAIIIGVVGSSQASRVDGLKKKSVQLQNEKRKYDSVIKQIAKIKRDQALLETKMNVIKSLKVNSQMPVRVFDEIASITPANRMWLKSLNFSGGGINLSGIALDNATIARYMRHLNASDYFSGAELKNSSMTVVANQKLKAFALSVNVSHPESGSSSTAPK